MKKNEIYHIFVFAVEKNGMLSWKVSAFTKLHDDYDYFNMLKFGIYIRKILIVKDKKFAIKKVLEAREILKEGKERATLLVDYGILEYDKNKARKQLSVYT